VSGSKHPDRKEHDLYLLGNIIMILLYLAMSYLSKVHLNVKK